MDVPRESSEEVQGTECQSRNGVPQMINEREKKSEKTKHELEGSCVLWKTNKKTKDGQSDF